MTADARRLDAAVIAAAAGELDMPMATNAGLGGQVGQTLRPLAQTADHALTSCWTFGGHRPPLQGNSKLK